jgi:hypothetical protein
MNANKLTEYQELQIEKIIYNVCEKHYVKKSSFRLSIISIFFLVSGEMVGKAIKYIPFLLKLGGV